MRETNMQLQYQEIFLLKWFVVALFDEKKKTNKKTHTHSQQNLFKGTGNVMSKFIILAYFFLPNHLFKEI